MTSASHAAASPAGSGDRYAWVDFAKGFCIIAVVAMWVSRGMHNESGLLYYFVAFAKPFRMPDFFLISGLFLSRVIDRPWRSYLDTKVVHYLYFLLLWTLIIVPATWVLKKAPGSATEAGAWLLAALYKPEGALWFILMLPVYFVVTRLLRRVPPWVVLPAAALAMIFPLHSGIHPLDWFGEYFVFFYAGHVLAGRFFSLADWAGRRPGLAIAAVALWAAFNAAVVKLLLPADLMLLKSLAGSESGAQSLSLALLLVLGFLGISALVLLSRLVSTWRGAAWLNYLGRNSIVVYLGFYVPMLLIQWAWRHWGLGLNPTLVAVGTWVATVLTALLVYWSLRSTALAFLYQRPAWAQLAPASTPALMRPAHGNS
jgi:uncharacterized membrane protein YcfT